MSATAWIWFVMGALSIVILLSAHVWMQDFGIRMNWWKWTLMVIWYGFLNFTLALPMTLVGEGESFAALRIFFLLVVVAVILGVGFWRLIAAGRKPSSR